MSDHLSESDLRRVERRHAGQGWLDDSIDALIEEVRERRAAEQRVRGVLAEWDETEPEDGWGRMAEEITAALGETK